jgi:hypothetical protein
MLTNSELTTVFRLVLIAKAHGSQVLTDAASFDGVVGQGCFAALDCQFLDVARRVVKSIDDTSR